MLGGRMQFRHSGAVGVSRAKVEADIDREYAVEQAAIRQRVLEMRLEARAPCSYCGGSPLHTLDCPACHPNGELR